MYRLCYRISTSGTRYSNQFLFLLAIKYFYFPIVAKVVQYHLPLHLVLYNRIFIKRETVRFFSALAGTHSNVLRMNSFISNKFLIKSYFSQNAFLLLIKTICIRINADARVIIGQENTWVDYIYV